MTIDKALHALETFQGDSLTESLSHIESSIIGSGTDDVEGFCADRGINDTLMESAIAVKRVAGQINVIIHAAGILRSLPGILEPEEKVESVFLGAGNTGRQFDLETNIRVAEYKFIDWQGGPESIRQNGIFKDFFVKYRGQICFWLLSRFHVIVLLCHDHYASPIPEPGTM